MKLRQHIGSLLFIAGLLASAAFAAFDARRGSSWRPRGDAELRAFPMLDRGKLLRFELERGGATLVLARERVQDGFSMASPERAAVDAAAVEQLFATLEMATVARELKDDVPKGAPLARGTLTFLGAPPQRFVLGPRAPVPEGAAYLALDGRAAVVVRAELALELMRSFDVYRDRSLVAVPPTEIVKMRIVGPSAASVERTRDGAFRLSGAGGLRVGRELSEGWLRAVPELRASRFVAEALRPTAPWLSLEVSGRDGKEARVIFGGACPDDDREVVASTDRDGARIIGCVPKVIAQAFVFSAEATLRDTRAFSLRIDEVAEVVVSGEPGLSLARAGAGFRERRPESRVLDADESDVAAAFIKGLLATSGELVAAPPAVTTPAHRIAMVRAGSDQEEEAVMVVDHDGLSYVHRLSDGAWLRITAAARRALAAPPAGMRVSALAPESYRAAAVTRVAVRCGTLVETMVRVDQGFVFEAPKARARVDGARVMALLQAIERARGHAASLPAVTGKAPAFSCTYVVSWRTDAGASDFVLELAAPPHEGDAAPGDVVGKVDAGAMTLPLDLATLLGASFAEAAEATDAGVAR